MYEAVDHQITVDVGGRNSRRLYEAARKKADRPLVEGAVDRLIEAIDADPEPTIHITTGFPIGPKATPETDGPPGAVVLGTAVAELGATPVFVVDERTRSVIDAVGAELGLDQPQIEPATGRLCNRTDPAAVVAVETAGRTADGRDRNMAGEDITAHVEAVDDRFEAAVDREIPTIAVGDGGNEIGMGCIQAAVEAHVDHGEKIATVTPVESLVVASVSNWGAYGIVAGLSLATGRQLLHTGETERRLLAAAVEAGAIDGVTGEPTESVDGIPAAVHAHVVDILRYYASQTDDARPE